jgi:hypothetical protein
MIGIGWISAGSMDQEHKEKYYTEKYMPVNQQGSQRTSGLTL